MAKGYLLDTGFFINGWRKWYRRDVFPGLWARVEESLLEREAYSIRAVYQELQYQDDDLASWAKARQGAFVPETEELGHQMSLVMKAIPNFVAAGGAPNMADPFIVAQAKLDGAIVVTAEMPATARQIKPTKPPKLPSACDELGVKWMSCWDFLAAIKLRL